MENYQNTKERRAQEVERYSILVTKSLNTLRLNSRDGIFYKEDLKNLLKEISGTKRSIIMSRLVGRGIIARIGKDDIGSLYSINNASNSVYVGNVREAVKAACDYYNKNYLDYYKIGQSKENKLEIKVSPIEKVSDSKKFFLDRDELSQEEKERMCVEFLLRVEGNRKYRIIKETSEELKLQ